MKLFPGFLPVLQKQLENLDLSDLERVNREGGIEVSDLLNFITKPIDYTVDQPYQVHDDFIKSIEDNHPDDFWYGRESLVNAETSLCFVVNENSFTYLETHQSTILEFQLMKFSWVKELWLLIDPKDRTTVEKLSSSVGARVKLLTRYESFSFTPNNELLLVNNRPIFHDCGPGDLMSVLTVSGLLENFRNSGGKYILVTNCNDVCNNGMPTLLGLHKRLKKPVTWEVQNRSSDPRKGILCEHEGFPQIVEKFRLSAHTKEDDFQYNSTDTCIFNSDLEFSHIKWKWHRTKVRSQNRLEVRYMRTLYDLTANFQTSFIKNENKLSFLEKV